MKGQIEIDICENCQESFNMWIEDKDYEKTIIKGALNNPIEAKEFLKQSI